MENCEELKIPAGSDADFRIPVLDLDGNPIDLTSFAKIFLIIHTDTKDVIAKFSKTIETGWGTMSITGTTNENIEFNINSAETLAAEGQKLYYELRILTDTPGVGDDVQDLIENDKYLCTISESLVSTLPSP